jgi:hypothetical protein
MFGFGAKTKCAKCESTSFRLKTIEPIGSNFTLNAVHCNKCGAPFGVVQKPERGSDAGRAESDAGMAENANYRPRVKDR